MFKKEWIIGWWHWQSRSRLSLVQQSSTWFGLLFWLLCFCGLLSVSLLCYVICLMLFLLWCSCRCLLVSFCLNEIQNLGKQNKILKKNSGTTENWKCRNGWGIRTWMKSRSHFIERAQMNVENYWNPKGMEADVVVEVRKDSRLWKKWKWKRKKMGGRKLQVVCVGND